jgi:hypothetical protein
MTTLRQIEANRRNARVSTGPRTDNGKRRSRKNAHRHGLSAETIIEPLEDPEDYQAFEAAILADYAPRTAVERELVGRLASLMWRIRRATMIETGLLQIQGEIIQEQRAERDTALAIDRISVARVREFLRARRSKQNNDDRDPCDDAERGADALDEARRAQFTNVDDPSRDLTLSFLRLAHVDNGAFDRLSRYEAIIWRQIVQTLFVLGTMRRR